MALGEPVPVGYYVAWVRDPESDGCKDHCDIVAHGVFLSEGVPHEWLEDPVPVAQFPYTGEAYSDENPCERSGVLAEQECDRLNAQRWAA